MKKTFLLLFIFARLKKRMMKGTPSWFHKRVEKTRLFQHEKWATWNIEIIKRKS